MKFEDFKKLKGEIKDKNFFNNYKGFSKLSYFLSYVGNAFSILFAYFFINEIISSTVLEPTTTTKIIITFVSIIILMTLELMKRFIFDKFTQSFINDKFKIKNKETGILGGICVLLIAVSFFFSLNGAEKYASKKDEINKNVITYVSTYKDSLTKKYDVKIVQLERQDSILFATNQTYENKLDKISKDYSDNTLPSSELRRLKTEMNQIRKDKEFNTNLIDKNETKIKEIKKEKDSEVLKYEEIIKKDASNVIEKTKGNPLLFLCFSTVIELLILFGIWFINYYKVRSVDDYEIQINKDPKYKTFNLWNEFLEIIYKKDSKVGDNLPFKNDILKLTKTSNMNLSVKELDEILKNYINIGILKKKGNRNTLSISKEEALELIKDYLKIE